MNILHHVVHVKNFVVHVIYFVSHLAQAGMEIADEGGITKVISKLEKW